jgi:hypothetical protein
VSIGGFDTQREAAAKAAEGLRRLKDDERVGKDARARMELGYYTLVARVG